MRGFRSGDRGQAGIALIIVIAWALSAVLVLTRTLVAAQEINNKVTVITSKLAATKGDTSYVAQLNQTENTANQILTAAAPLTGQLAVVQSTAAHIQQEVDGITPPVQDINGTVHQIQPKVAQILNVVNGGPTSIAAQLAAIRGGQSSVILTDVQRIKSDTTSIITNAQTIDINLCHIDNLLGAGSNPNPNCTGPNQQNPLAP
jgi:SMC interacting uncharacterized protein involved in chromosome segregation